jgi:hypothetical protein
MPPDPSAIPVVDGFRPSSRVQSTLGGRLRGDVQTYSAIPPSDLTKVTDLHRVPVGASIELE